MPPDSAHIHHVSDTAIWVAHYRALESERPDALFQDKLAGVLAGTRGGDIARSLERTQRYTRWSVVVRTVVIDQLIQKLVSEGVDMVLNLGAGLDTRPYRLKLPETLQWVEVDHPEIIEHKEKLIGSQVPGVRLERVALDLADAGERRKLFARLGAQAKRVLVLTEGVVLYLSEEQVGALADDLHAQESMQFWIAEYFAPQLYKLFKGRKRSERFKNAPVQFFPLDWMGFFRSHGWTPQESRYLAEEGRKLGREIPHPLWVRAVLLITSKERAAQALRFVGYVVFRKNG
jgi:methyltransferase (TIGR00027 family)